MCLVSVAYSKACLVSIVYSKTCLVSIVSSKTCVSDTLQLTTGVKALRHRHLTCDACDSAVGRMGPGLATLTLATEGFGVRL